MVVPWAAKAATVSPSGMDAAVRPGSRVATSDWATPGTVSSRPTAAEAAASEPTPGTSSKRAPLGAPVDLLLHRRVEREVAGVQPHDAGIGRGAAYTASDVLEGHARRVVHRGVGTGVVEHLVGHQRRRPHDDVGSARRSAAAQRQQVGGAGSGAHEGDHVAGPAPGGTMTVAR